jgi:hypothetical protein
VKAAGKHCCDVGASNSKADVSGTALPQNSQADVHGMVFSKLKG